MDESPLNYPAKRFPQSGHPASPGQIMVEGHRFLFVQDLHLTRFRPSPKRGHLTTGLSKMETYILGISQTSLIDIFN